MQPMALQWGGLVLECPRDLLVVPPSVGGVLPAQELAIQLCHLVGLLAVLLRLPDPRAEGAPCRLARLPGRQVVHLHHHGGHPRDARRLLPCLHRGHRRCARLHALCDEGCGHRRDDHTQHEESGARGAERPVVATLWLLCWISRLCCDGVVRDWVDRFPLLLLPQWRHAARHAVGVDRRGHRQGPHHSLGVSQQANARVGAHFLSAVSHAARAPGLD
mmetsp:Transcript_56346/g.163456  ORF Transcript_56346/g.163456 Transcript_56346/m.163456 type:complete len:218 (+) Transcript_56346:712-1365(+)